MLTNLYKFGVSSDQSFGFATFKFEKYVFSAKADNCIVEADFDTTILPVESS